MMFSPEQCYVTKYSSQMEMHDFRYVLLYVNEQMQKSRQIYRGCDWT